MWVAEITVCGCCFAGGGECGCCFVVVWSMIVCSFEDFVVWYLWLLVFIGVGCSIGLGIFDYRDVDGEWKCSLFVMF